ncbi:MAG: carboxymuconolactone decarboxylase family protein, partial [Hyphomonadaceae bacterium]
NPVAARLLIAFHTEIMRAPSALSAGERELIAAFVSALNACRYCHGVHESTAAAFGADPALMRQWVEGDFAAAPERLRPLLSLARKLTIEQTKVAARDIEEAIAEGWDERAVHDLINVVALFNFMNRYVHGHGLALADGVLAARGKLLMSDGYDRLLPLLED